MTGIESLREYAGRLKDIERHCYIGFDLEAIADQIERETLPRPMFEDGEVVEVGGIKTVRGGWVIDGHRGDWCMVKKEVSHGERVKRPAPKVLDADGVPIEVGDEVWQVGRTSTYEVRRVDAEHGKVYIVDAEKREGYSGERVLAPGKLTHKKPETVDSWERIEEDARKTRCEYFYPRSDDGNERACVDCRGWVCGQAECGTGQRVDLVRRCRELAEKEAGHDSWERIEGDLIDSLRAYRDFGGTYDEMERDAERFVRRCRALAEKEAGR